MPPTATYRLQFQSSFGFDDAAKITAYLSQLGVSHIYASPWLKARPGSTHGYDIVDHHLLNPELGDQSAFNRMVDASKANALGLILDFVPNHMGVGGSDNPLWLDVLEWGPESGHAGWFDIDWGPDRSYLHNKLLVPVLGNQYGIELDAGELLLKFDENEGSFAVWAYDVHKLPICPLHYSQILGDKHPELEKLGDEFLSLPDWRPQATRRAGELKAQLSVLWNESDGARTAIQEAVRSFNGEAGVDGTWTKLHSLIEIQHWRAAHFRVAGDDINYRRFFNVNELAGLRMELPDVFDHSHKMVLDLLCGGVLDGLRIDHIDGLRDPKAYLIRLRDAARSQGRDGFYLIVEKILAHHESLRKDWPVDGTTGYEFTNMVLGLLIDPSGEAPLTQLYHEFTGITVVFADIARDSKLRIMRNEMAGELNVLGREAARVARSHPRTADFTQNILRRAIREVVACFPVYRTYVDTAGPATEEDLRYIDWAIKKARTNEVEVDPTVFEFLDGLLSGELVAKGATGFSRQAVLRCAMKVQQYSGPVMAKGVEDTAFYRYNRFVTLNEVGGFPGHFGVGLSNFHKANAHRLNHWPASMLTTSTHDTKRGEDVRARLAVLSELPDEWAKQVRAWSRILRAYRRDIEGTAPPDQNDEYLFYQLLVGSWPADFSNLDELDEVDLNSYRDRLKAAMVKSLREAKVHTTWESPNQDYENAMLALVSEALDLERSKAFLQAFLPFQNRVAELGAHNSLVQTTLKLTVPGVPDVYQGSELWDLSLADPDNRRPVDFGRRLRMLQELKHGPDSIKSLRKTWRDGAIKLFVTSTLLQFRRTNPDLFATGEYEILNASGAMARNICAFGRRLKTARILVATALFPAELQGDGPWGGTSIAPPSGSEPGGWQDVFTGRMFRASDETLHAAELFQDLPVCVLAQG